MKDKKNLLVGLLLVGFIILLIVIALVFNNKPKTNETIQTASDIKRMLKTIYNNLSDTIPDLETKEISLKDKDLVKSLTGLDNTDDIKTLVTSEPLMNAQALEVAVLKTTENANVEKMMQTMQENIDMNRWICVSAEKMYLVSSGDVIFMVMADSDWAQSIYDEFLKYLDKTPDKSLEKANSFDDDLLPSDNPIAD